MPEIESQVKGDIWDMLEKKKKREYIIIYFLPIILFSLFQTTQKEIATEFLSMSEYKKMTPWEL